MWIQGDVGCVEGGFRMGPGCLVSLPNSQWCHSEISRKTGGGGLWAVRRTPLDKLSSWEGPMGEIIL